MIYDGSDLTTRTTFQGTKHHLVLTSIPLCAPLNSTCIYEGLTRFERRSSNVQIGRQ